MAFLDGLVKMARRAGSAVSQVGQDKMVNQVNLVFQDGQVSQVSQDGLVSLALVVSQDKVAGQALAVSLVNQVSLGGQVFQD